MLVIGVGNAAAAMEAYWDGDLSGFVVTRHGHGAVTRTIEVAEATHPVPDEAGVRATQRMLIASET